MKYNKNPVEMAQHISDWERGADEAFTDYFMHDNVKDVSWAFWLLGKGYSERANMIIDEIQDGNTCIDQSILYEIHSGVDWSQELYNKDVMLWAEFLTASDRYFKRIVDWFGKNK